MGFATRAKEYAIECHQRTNHSYDGRPYSVHLYGVLSFAVKYQSLIPQDDLSEVLAACWCHDVIEDCRQTYNDVYKNVNKRVAEIVYALTNEKGKNRSERANDKYYDGIVKTKYAIFVKLCDRLANIEYSKENNPHFLEVYAKENQLFKNRLYNEHYAPMFEEIECLLTLKQPTAL